MRTLCAVALIGSLVLSALPTLAGRVRETIELAPLDVSARRDRQTGGFTKLIRETASRFPATTRILLALRRAEDINPALLVNYHLYPRATKTVYGHRSATVEAPSRPLIRVDARKNPPLAIMTDLEMRHETLSEQRVIGQSPMVEVQGRAIVPLVASLYGAHADYTVEAVLMSESAQIVTLRFYPSGTAKHVSLHPGQRVVFHDLWFEVHRTLDMGWVTIDAEKRLRASFALVNHATRSSAPLKMFDAVGAFTGAFNAEKLWIVNTSSVSQRVTVGGRSIEVAPEAISSLSGGGSSDVITPAGVLVFGSTETAGKTIFYWPDSA